MTNFIFEPQEIPGLVLIRISRFGDERGWFSEVYRKDVFSANGINADLVQENRSFSVRGVLRGLHFQKEPRAQAKLVQAISGKIRDVAVDIRPDSPSFLKWLSFDLDSDSGDMLYIPEGFAHGFAVVSDTAQISYKTSDHYAPGTEGGILWNDEDLNIDWGVEEPILSPKDTVLPTLKKGALNV